jgi:hypothetical protein
MQRKERIASRLVYRLREKLFTRIAQLSGLSPTPPLPPSTSEYVTFSNCGIAMIINGVSSSFLPNWPTCPVLILFRVNRIADLVPFSDTIECEAPKSRQLCETSVDEKCKLMIFHLELVGDIGKIVEPILETVSRFIGRFFGRSFKRFMLETNIRG